jgi:hypothetical protein
VHANDLAVFNNTKRNAGNVQRFLLLAKNRLEFLGAFVGILQLLLMRAAGNNQDYKREQYSFQMETAC